MSAASIILTIIVLVLAAVVIAAAWFAIKTRRIAAHAEKLVPAVGKFVTIDGNRIHYIEKGEGPPILFVHGLGGHHYHFRDVLREFGEGYRLIALDRAGSGYSTRPAGARGRLPQQASEIRRFIEVMGLEKPLLVGHSLGGAIALAAALDHPETISGLALIAPLTHHREAIPPEFAGLYIRSPLLRRLVSSTIAIPRAVKQAPRTLALVFGPQQPPADYAVEGGALAGLRPGHFFATSTDFVAIEHDLPVIQQRYGEITMPVGIFFGTADRLLPYEEQGLAMQGKIAGLDLELAPGIGHMAQFVATEQVVAFIRRMAAKAFAA